MLAVWLSTAAHPVFAETFETESRTEMSITRPATTPYVGEMILLRMRSAIHANVALYEMRQPDLPDFDWQQFGRDTPTEATVDGFTVPGIERVLAIFPRRAGRLHIPPFTRHVTIVTRDNRRVETDFSSDPLDIEVAAYDAVGHPDEWWLPAESVLVTQNWEPLPDTATRGSSIRRTVTIEAHGTTAEHLPPPPAIAASGASVFAGPVERTTTVTEDGPVARAVYRWNIRLTSDAGVALPAMHIAWFDTGSRVVREATLAAQPFGATGPSPARMERPWQWRELAAPISMLTGAGAALWVVALLAFTASMRRPPRDILRPLDGGSSGR